jgi:hypothetical protein
LREAFKEALPFLMFRREEAPRVKPEDVRRALLEQVKDEQIKPFADKLGMSVAEARAIIIRAQDKYDGWQAFLSEKEAVKKLKMDSKCATNGGDCGEEFEQIQESQLLSYLKAGWQIVHRLESGEVIVKR